MPHAALVSPDCCMQRAEDLPRKLTVLSFLPDVVSWQPRCTMRMKAAVFQQVIREPSHCGICVRIAVSRQDRKNVVNVVCSR
jgi:hypothetical protein